MHKLWSGMLPKGEDKASVSYCASKTKCSLNSCNSLNSLNYSQFAITTSVGVVANT
jgi:hypothetical protein